MATLDTSITVLLLSMACFYGPSSFLLPELSHPLKIEKVTDQFNFKWNPGFNTKGVSYMIDFLSDMILSNLLFSLHEKHPVLYAVVMGCILALFAGIAVFFYTVGSPVKGTFMVVFTLLMTVLFVYGLRKNTKSSRPTWNSWFDKHR